MDHPQYLTWGLLPESAQVFPYRGPLVTSAIGDLCDGPFRAQRAAFRISLGNEAWSAVVGGVGGDPHVTTLDFINGTNSSGLNKKDFTQLAEDNSALFGVDLTRTLGNLISRQFRIAFAVEQSPDPNNRVTLSSVTDALNLPRPRDCLRYFGLYETGYRHRLSHEEADLQQVGSSGLHQACRRRSRRPRGDDRRQIGATNLRRSRSRNGHLSYGR